MRSNWSSFRNEWFNGKPIIINIENFTPMPATGHIEFDYSSIVRPEGDHEDLVPITDERFLKVLNNLSVIGKSKNSRYLEKLEVFKEKLKKSNTKIGKSFFGADWNRAKKIGLAMEHFYDTIGNRNKCFSKIVEREMIKITTDSAEAEFQENVRVSAAISSIRTELGSPKLGSIPGTRPGSGLETKIEMYEEYVDETTGIPQY